MHATIATVLWFVGTCNRMVKLPPESCMIITTLAIGAGGFALKPLSKKLEYYSLQTDQVALLKHLTFTFGSRLVADRTNKPAYKKPTGWSYRPVISRSEASCGTYTLLAIQS